MKASTRKISGARSKRRSAHVPAATPSASRFQSILVPIDFSAQSERALQYALALARKTRAKLTLLHVVEPIGTPDFLYYPLMVENEKLAKAARERLEKTCARAKIQPALLDRVLVRSGVAFNEIADAARTLHADLIAIATHGYTGLKHVLLGSTTERVVRHAPCPVLVVR